MTRWKRPTTPNSCLAYAAAADVNQAASLAEAINQLLLQFSQEDTRIDQGAPQKEYAGDGLPEAPDLDEILRNAKELAWRR